MPVASERAGNLCPDSFFPEWTETLKKWISLLALGAPVYLVVLIAYGVTPEAIRIGYQPDQPVPYSHALHAGRARHRLPVLPHDGRARGEGRGAAGGDVHELPLARQEGLGSARADPRGLRRERAGALDARPRPSGLRLLQPHGARERGDRLRDVPRPHRSDGQGLPGQAADDGVVHQLPQESEAVSPRSREHHEDGLRRSVVGGRIAMPGEGERGSSRRTTIHPPTACSTCHR